MNHARVLRDLSGAAAARVLRGLGAPVRPRLLTLNATDRCNCRCVMCHIHARGAAGPELTTTEVVKIFSDPAAAGLDVLRVTGGEPFLRDDLADIFRAAQGRTACRIIHITTNGTLPERVERFALDALPSRAALHLQVSLDALDARHDAMRGAPGTLEKVLETLERLSAAGKKFRFHLGINQTVGADNLDQMRPVHELARRLGAGHNIILEAKHHEGRDLSRAMRDGKPLPFETGRAMTAEEIERFYREAAELKRDVGLADVRAANFSAFLRDLSEEYLNEGGRNRLLRGEARPAPRCMAMFTHARITAGGDVAACSALAARPAGNVRDASLGEVWRSPRAAALRREVRRCPGCWVECDINPSIFYSGAIAPWAVRRWMADAGFRKMFKNGLRGSEKTKE